MLSRLSFRISSPPNRFATYWSGIRRGSVIVFLFISVQFSGVMLKCSMLIGTHALLPVCACLAVDHASLLAGRDRVFPAHALWFVAGFGMLPDLCSPHVMLEDRYTSFPHSVWFMAVVVAPALLVAGFFGCGLRFRIALACWLATAAHLAADAVSGGIAWLYPWNDEVIGRYFIDLDWWAWSDGLFVLLAWGLLRTVPHMEARNIRRRS